MQRPSGALSPDDAMPRLSALGADGVLVRFGEQLTDSANRAALAFGRAVAGAPPPGVTDVATSLVSVLVRFDPGVTRHADLARALSDLAASRLWTEAPWPDNRTRWHVPVAFGGDHGPALTAVAHAAGRTEAAAIADITGAPLRVLAIGFAPGQPYLGFLPDTYDLPRQSGLTDTVPAASIVLAVRQITLFATAAPTGWQWIGQTRFPCFRPTAKDPVLLTAGDEIAFHAVGHGELEGLAAHPTGGARSEALA